MDLGQLNDMARKHDDFSFYPNAPHDICKGDDEKHSNLLNIMVRLMCMLSDYST